MVEMETSEQEIDPSSSYEMLKARVIWKQHCHDIQERACRTCGGGPCQIGKVTCTSINRVEISSKVSPLIKK